MKPAITLGLAFALLLRGADGQNGEASPSRSAEFQAHAQKAEAAIHANDVMTARRELLTMLHLDPENVNVNSNLGMINFVAGEFEQSASYFQAALQHSPQLWSAQAFLGMCRLHLGDSREGRSLLEAALPHVPDRSLRRQASLELVRSYSSAGMLDKAEPVLARLQESDPSDSEVLYATYRLHSELASAALRKLSATDQDSPWVHLVLGQNFLAQEQYQRAIEEFQKVLVRGPQISGIHYQLGEALLYASRNEESRSKAEREFLAELRLYPDDAGSLEKLGEIYLERSDLAKAKEYLQQAIARDPDSAQAHELLSKTWEREGDLRSATSELERAARTDVASKSTHYHLAQLYRAQGRADDAERELKEYRRLAATEPASSKEIGH